MKLICDTCGVEVERSTPCALGCSGHYVLPERTRKGLAVLDLLKTLKQELVADPDVGAVRLMVMLAELLAVADEEEGGT